MLLILAPLLSLFRLIASFDVQAEHIAADPLNSFYYTSGYNLFRVNKNGSQTGSHTLKTYGKIYSIDPGNPLKTLVYYRDFNTVLYLDNFLNQSGEPVRLQDLGFERATMVCSSYNNALWVYDSGNGELIRLDENLALSNRTGRLRQVVSFTPEPVSMIERGNNLYLNDPLHGILIFDIYGTYLRTVPIKGLEDFSVSGENILYVKRDSLHSYDQKLLQDSAYVLPEKNVKAIRNINEKVFLLTEGSVRLYERN
jgi:hypothetical protein